MQADCRCNKRKQNDRTFTLIKDCICAEWSIPPGQIQTIYQSSGYRSLYASGFISIDDNNDSLDFVIVRFFLGDMEVGTSMKVFNDSSVAFSLTRFNRITVECTQSSTTL